MNICAASTVPGVQCRRRIRKGERFCGHHKGSEIDWKRAAMTVGGGVLGTLLLPGFGTAAGALLGNVVDRAQLAAAAKRRVFLSFDYSHDRRMKTMFLGQSKLARSPFEVVDCSLKEAAPEKRWVDHAADAIDGAELLVILVGEHTWRAKGVLIEVELARRLGRPAIQIWAYSDGRGRQVAGGGKMYPWNWDVLAHVLD